MMDDNDETPGTGAGTKRRGPGRPPKAETQRELTQLVEQGLKGVADLFDPDRQGGSVDTLAELIRRDSNRMAEFLAAFADRHTKADDAVRRLFGAGSAVGFARAFGPLVSHLLGRLNARVHVDDDGDELGGNGNGHLAGVPPA